MLKTYTKIILGIITFLGTLFGPFSVIVQPIAQQADSYIHTVGFQNNVVYATQLTDSTSTVSKTVTPTDSDLAVTLESFLKVIYVLLWPALFIAGLAMDNSLVYGEIFGLDDALFKFWQIMKNFANFALGFIFIWSILKYIFDIKGGKAKNPKDIIVKLLLGAIGVNTSWFIIGALVDLSTALTVGIGGLPLQLIGDQNIADKPIFGSITSIKLNDAVGQRNNSPILHTRPGSDFTAQGKYFLPCLIEDNHIVWNEPKRQTAFGVSNGKGSITGTTIGRDNIVKNYCIARGQGINKEAYEKKNPLVTDGAAMRIVYDDSFTAIQTDGKCSANSTCQTLKSFTKKTEGYQGAFYSLYASLLNLSTIHIGVPKSNVSLGMEMLMKMVIALAYLIPLMILAIVLIMRIGYLWLIIAFSPFIVLASIKGFSGTVKSMDGEGISLGGIKEKFNINTVISLLLLPVIVTFVISLSIVFLSSLSEGLTKNGSAESMGIYQRTEGNYKCYDVAITSICLDMPGTDIGTGVFDYFSWTIMNLFGIGLMWFAVMTALKSSKFTEKVAGTIETLGKDMMMSANFIPIPGGKEGDRTSLSALKELPRSIENQLSSSKAQGSQILAQTMEGVGRDLVGGDKKVKESITNTTKAFNDQIVKTGAKTPATFAAQKTQLVKDINAGNFTANKNMSFSQADNSLAFANMLAAQSGSTHKFDNGDQLFSKKEGQQILAKWLDKTNVEWKNVKDMYGNGVRATDRDGEKGYENQIKSYLTTTTPEKKLTEDDIKKIRDEKKMLVGKDTNKELLIHEGKLYSISKGTNKLDNENGISIYSSKLEETKESFKQINTLMSADVFKNNTQLKTQTLPGKTKRMDKDGKEVMCVINIENDPNDKTKQLKILTINPITPAQEQTLPYVDIIS